MSSNLNQNGSKPRLKGAKSNSYMREICMQIKADTPVKQQYQTKK